jgi:hypothetical protein
LPPLELFLVRATFALYRTLRSDAFALRHFLKEASRLVELAKRVKPEFGTEPVLIRKIFGIEDSSRFWSPYMVIHHLVIVDSGILQMIERLSGGSAALPEVRIADAKPDPSSGPEVIGKFESVVQKYEKLLERLSDLKGTPRHPHPWFGPIDAHGWHCLAAVHHSIHRRQLQVIYQRAR